jgi:riboflavin kinase / FMN adenylyltransferase
MKIYHTIPDNKNLFRNPVVTIGNFDGVHIGHRKIFNTLLRVAQETGGDAVVITFSTHPRKVLYPEIPIKVLTTTGEKTNAIFNCGVSNIVLLHFTREMADMPAAEFFNDILIMKIDAREIVIGYDHAFGKNREGNMEFLTALADKRGIGLTKVDEEMFDSNPVSSSWLRKEIEAGNISLANRLLGRHFSVTGIVAKGYGRGRQIGYPTANIIPDIPDKILPGDGVYAVTVRVGEETKWGMLNIGTNPTFENSVRTVEVNIFDFDRNIYEEEITVFFHERIREEVAFSSVDKLVSQINRDKETTLHYIRECYDTQSR